MQEKLLQYLKENNKAVSFMEIQKALQIEKKQDLTKLANILNELTNDFILYQTKKNKYLLLEKSHLKKGRLIVNKKGFGFVSIEQGDDIFISENNMNGAIHGDIVVVEPISKGAINEEGRVLEIVKRQLKRIVGDFYFRKNKGYVDIDDEKIKLKITIPSNKQKGAVAGSKVLVEIKEKIKNNFYNGDIIKVLGHRNDPGVDILAIVYKYGLEDEFSHQTIREIEKVPEKIFADEIKNRRDLRDEMIFTIDGDDTKDIDDALSFRKLKNNNYLLGVHIADVSYYVKENSAIDKDGFARATSLYLADRVIPMLPHKLSNGICSLNPNVERLAITCEMEIDEIGKVVNYEIFSSVIKSQKQMTYQNVNAILEDKKVPKGYEGYVDKLKEMHVLAQKLRKMKEKRGFIDFDIKEPKILVDEIGKAVDIKLRDRGSGEMLIEDFMIAANETVAKAIYQMKLPFIYRVHGMPNDEQVEKFINFVRVLRYNINISAQRKNFSPKDMQMLLEQLKDKQEYGIFAKLLLRSMEKAIYDKTNIGHFGLASKCYTHFTSPIRRYPDLTVHRLLRKYLFHKQTNKAEIERWHKSLAIICDQSSQKEQDALECEREVNDMKMAEYMTDHIGEHYQGLIVSVMSFGMFIELDNGIEGLVKVSNLTDDFYEIDESNFLFKGRRNKKTYRLGDRVKVAVKAASKEAKTIDLEIVE